MPRRRAARPAAPTVSRKTATAAFAIGLLACQAPPGWAQGWSLYDGGQSAFVSFHNAATNTHLNFSPSIMLDFAGFTPSAAAFTMDTGSTGIVASPENFTPGPGAINMGAGELTYSSSGQRNLGTWWLTDVSIKGADGTVVAIARVPVLQVTEIRCVPGARHCTATTSPTGVAMMGVGFGREADHQPQSTPDKNPLLNLTHATVGGSLQSLPSGWHNGYIVSRGGVTLGLSAAETAGAAFVKLLPAATYAHEWQAAPGAVSVNGVTGQGTALVDTGIGGMFLHALPGTGLVPSQAVADGTVVGITLPGGAADFLSYSFTVQNGAGGDLVQNTPLTPQNITVSGGSNAFVNTGRHFLNSFDVIFDAGNGFIGYRLAPAAAAGRVAAGLALQGNVALPATFFSSLPSVLLADTTLQSAGTAGFTGGINGHAALTLAGGGTFNLAGPGGYTGGTTVTGGTTLSIVTGRELGTGALTLAGGILGASTAGSGFNLALPVVLGQGGGAISGNGQASMLSGVISGSGALTVGGGGTVTLTGANTHSGGTLVGAGTVLAVNADAALGAATAGLTLSGGTLRALGNITSQRPVTVAAAGGTFDTGAGFVIQLNGPTSFLGPVAHVGAGRFQLAGDTTSSQIVVAASGTLSVNGTLTAPALAIGSGATLAGNGVVNAPTAVAGTIAPGSSPGTLTFTAPVVMLPGAALAIEVDGPGTGTGAGNHDRVVVTGVGNSFTAAGQIVPQLRGIPGSATNAFTPAFGQAFTIVQADGGVLGSFSGIAQPASGLPANARFDALYGTNAVALVTTPARYAALGGTANAAAAGAGLDAFRPAAGPRLAGEVGEVFNTLYQMSAGQLGTALDQLSGSAYGDGLTGRMESRRLFSGAIAGQLAAGRGGLADRQSTSVSGGERTAWIQALGQPMLRLGGDGHASGFSGSMGGVAAGMDMRLGASWRLGAAIGFTSGTLTPRAGGRIDSDAVHFAIYGGWSDASGLFAEADVGGGWAHDRTRRNLASFGRSALGSADGGAVGGGLRAGLRFERRGWALEPSLALRAERVDRGALAETGAGSLGLNVRSGALDSVRSSLGVTAQRRFATAWDGVSLTPVFRLAWAHELADGAALTNAAFQGAPGAGFRVRSARPGRDAAVLGAGLTLGLRGGVSVFADYAADLRENLTSQAVTAGLRMSF
ncbi:autotransporter outer membrane beta-barrel domain-containing protein [Roseococcus sp. SYP-B2431]|uniref:autotransporter family protein n=1 Tax=Roseococcus sp. SYP-B2431 TaxID=2496640 RepID=UPI0013F46B68|nr:autotransporter outer membrane beta-barrel domain-containing protein [Roseococcus sp. SYP-B2431]